MWTGMHSARPAIAVLDNLPEDEQLAAIADDLFQAVFDWAWWDGSRLRLQNAVRRATAQAAQRGRSDFLDLRDNPAPGDARGTGKGCP